MRCVEANNVTVGMAKLTIDGEHCQRSWWRTFRASSMGHDVRTFLRSSRENFFDFSLLIEDSSPGLLSRWVFVNRKVTVNCLATIYQRHWRFSARELKAKHRMQQQRAGSETFRSLLSSIIWNRKSCSGREEKSLASFKVSKTFLLVR